MKHRRPANHSRDPAHVSSVRPPLLRYLHAHRKRANPHRVFKRRLELEALAAAISGRMLGASIAQAQRFEQDVRRALSDIGAAFGADYCFVHLLSTNGKVIEQGYEWRADRHEPSAENQLGQPTRAFPHLADEYRDRVMHGAMDSSGVFIFPDILLEAGVRTLLHNPDGQAIAFIPLHIGANLAGYFGLRSRLSDPGWPTDDLKQLKLIGELIANALLNVRAEERFTGERNLLQALIDAVPYGMYAKDTTGRVIACNQTAAAFNGRTIHEVIGSTDWDVFNDEAAQRYRNDEQKVIETGIPLLEYEEIVVDHTGAPRWFSSTKTQLRDATGAILGIAGVGRDITEQKEIKQALSENEARFRALFDASSAAITILHAVSLPDGAGRDYEIVDINSSYETIMENPRDAVIGRLITDIFGASSTVMKELDAVAQTGVPSKTEWYINSIDKHLYVSACQLSAGYIALLFMDISTAKKAEEELRQAESRYRNVFENAMTGVFRSTPDGKLLFVNTAMARIHGYDTPQEMVDTVANDIANRIFVDPRKCDEYIRILESTGVVSNFDAQHRCKDGSVIWTRIHARINRSDPKIPWHYDGFLEDITARKEAERIMQERERQFRFLAENMRDVIFTLDNARRITYISPSVKLLRGLAPEQAIQQGFMEPFTPDSRAIIRDAMARRSAAESAGKIDSVFYLELQEYHVNGSLRWVELLTQSLLDADGRKTGFLGIARDITTRKETEDKLQYASTHDALTGLYNRAHFLDELIHLCKYGLYPLSILMADVDGLKRANDQLGHAAGDELLRRTAQVLTAASRSDTLVARYGGDEFTILLPDTGVVAARAAVLLVQAELNAHNALYNGEALSFAIGAATATTPMTPDELMSIVDKHMYDNKRSVSRL